MTYEELRSIPEAPDIIRRTLDIKKCWYCGGGGKANLQKARPTDCIHCGGRGFVSSK